MAKKAYLVLENGDVYEGFSFGAETDAVGEIVFNTSMVGYLETLTDPNYFGQIVVQTFPLAGNYGVIPADFESAGTWLKAYVTREWCSAPSNFRCEGDLDAFLRAQGIPGLYGIDTRRLTKTIREQGVMNAFITTDESRLPEAAALCSAYAIKNAPEAVSTSEAYETVNDVERTVVLWDFGAKESITTELCSRGCKVIRVPASASAEEILSYEPDGIVLSDGPGDPADNTAIIAQLRKLIAADLPLFGIGLGHQLLALAQNGKTYKHRYGHRGGNQPVKDLESGRVFITSQNHGYVVCHDTLPDGAVITHTNANDGTCEGLTYPGKPFFSVQFQPDAAGGPMATTFLYDRFLSMMGDKKA